MSTFRARKAEKAAEAAEAAAAVATADAAALDNRIDDLRQLGIGHMVSMARVLQTVGETDEPDLFEGWTRALAGENKAQAAIKFDEAMRAVAELDADQAADVPVPLPVERQPGTYEPAAEAEPAVAAEPVPAAPEPAEPAAKEEPAAVLLPSLKPERQATIGKYEESDKELLAAKRACIRSA